MTAAGVGDPLGSCPVWLGRRSSTRANSDARRLRRHRMRDSPTQRRQRSRCSPGRRAHASCTRDLLTMAVSISVSASRYGAGSEIDIAMFYPFELRTACTRPWRAYSRPPPTEMRPRTAHRVRVIREPSAEGLNMCLVSALVGLPIERQKVAPGQQHLPPRPERRPAPL